MSTRVALLLMLVSLLAVAAPVALEIPYSQPGRVPGEEGPAALWQPSGQPWFTVRTRSGEPGAGGSVQRQAFSPGTGQTGSPVWDAGPLLDQTDPRQRCILTPDAASGGGKLINFDWPALPDSLRTVLDGDGLGEARVAYLRGDRAREVGRSQGVFRARRTLLGDVVRSTPLIVGPPVPGGPAARREFVAAYARRDTAVYVGANDGMLHAFSAENGRELFAFIPAALQGQLGQLSAPDYVPRAWVDASAAHADADVGGRWRTVLASGMGMGARGLFLLDISDPGSCDDGPAALWEFTERDDGAIGHLHAPPLLTRLPTALEGGAWSGRGVAIVPSGINPLTTAADPALFLLALDKAPGAPWQLNGNYLRVDLPGAGTLSPPAIVAGLSGEALHAYAGDLDGNLWHVDLAARLARRVFTAKDPNGVPQPIAHAPHIIHAPGGGYLIIAGTGKLLEEGDLQESTFSVQSLYAIHDAPEKARVAVRSRDDLVVRTLSGTADYEISGPPVDYGTWYAPRGWYIDFAPGAEAGERAAGSPVGDGGIVLFQTVFPAVRRDSGESTGRLYVIRGLTGLAAETLASAKRDQRTGYLTRASPLQQLIFISGAGKADKADPTGRITVRRTLTLFQQTPRTAPLALDIEVTHSTGRLGWREISNWDDLHEAALKKDG